MLLLLHIRFSNNFVFPFECQSTSYPHVCHQQTKSMTRILEIKNYFCPSLSLTLCKFNKSIVGSSFFFASSLWTQMLNTKPNKNNTRDCIARQNGQSHRNKRSHDSRFRRLVVHFLVVCVRVVISSLSYPVEFISWKILLRLIVWHFVFSFAFSAIKAPNNAKTCKHECFPCILACAMITWMARIAFALFVSHEY